MAESPRSAVFPAIFSITFAIAYPIAVERNLPLFTYHPAIGEFGWWAEAPRDGPAMYWYGWLGSAAIVALIAGWISNRIWRSAGNIMTSCTWAIPVATMLAFAWLLRGFFFR